MPIVPSDYTFVLPDPLKKWPWKYTINPHYRQAKGESSAWLQSFSTLMPRTQGMLRPSKIDVLRACCDLMGLFLIYDEYTDAATSHEAQQLAETVMDAIRSPGKARPAGECVVGEIARQFWQLSSRCASEGARRRFIEAFEIYTNAVSQEAQDRARNLTRNIDEYILFRRSTAAMKAAFMPIQFSLNLPDEVFEDPVIQRLTDACMDLCTLVNDMYSYNIEQARGDIHNIVTIVMYHEKIGLNEAMRWVGDYCSTLVRNVLSDLCHVPSFGGGGELDAQVKHYLDGMGYWVRGNDSWSFESQKYFGRGGPDIKKSRKVVLLPRSKGIFEPMMCSRATSAAVQKR